MSWLFGSKWQLKSLNLDDFTIAVDSDNLFLAKQPIGSRYLGLWVRNGVCWDDHILELCRKMYYHIHMFRRLSKILPSALLLNIYKAYVQSKIDYGLSIWGCAKEVNINHVPRIQNWICLQESCVIILNMSNSHYNRLTQIQSLLFCYLFIIQLKLTKWTQTCVI